MIRLDKIDSKSFYKIINMKLPEEQSRFVASNVVSLAQAWLYTDNARPYAICNDDEVVGFLMLDWDEEERTVGIWRLMIAFEHQNKGYGRAAVKAAVDLARSSDKIDLVYTSYVPTNEVARNLYYSFGLRENGKKDDDELFMTLPLTTHPKVGMLTADEEDKDDILEVIRYEKSLEHSIPKSMQDEAKLTLAITNGHVTRFAVMGETVAFTVEGETLVDSRYSKYADEIARKTA